MNPNADRIVRLHELGGPDVLRIESIDREAPRGDEILIDVAYLGLNNSEAQLRRGDYPMMKAKMPSRIGRECAGVVAAVGADVTDITVGDRVCTIPAFDVGRNGVYGQWCVVPRHGVVPLPAGLGIREGAAIWQQYLTAYGPLVLYGETKPGDVVLIIAGASSVGLGSIQIAKTRGATVVATTRTAAKADIMRQQGADHVVVSSQTSVADEVLRLTNGAGFDICMDPVAGPGVAELARAAGLGGRIFLYGQLDPNPAPLPLIDLLKKGASIRGYTLWEITLDPALRHQAVTDIRTLIERKGLRPVIDSEFEFDDVIAAHRYLEAGRQAGKIVVRVGGESP